MTQFTYQERFFQSPSRFGINYAPMTIGAPANIYNVDQSVFKHSKAEKDIKKAIKSDWKKQMMSFYGESWRKHNNLPETLNH